MASTWDPGNVVDSVPAGTATFTNGNRTFQYSSVDGGVALSTTSVGSAPSGKVTIEASGDWRNTTDFIVLYGTDPSFTNGIICGYIDSVGWIASSLAGGTLGTPNLSPSPTSNDVVSVDIDWTAKTVSLRVNNSTVSGVGGSFTDSPASLYAAAFSGSNGAITGNLDTAQLAYTPPSGYVSWDAFAGGGGPTSYTLTADAGSFTTTGQAANLLLGPYWTLVGITEAAVSASGNYTLTEPSGVQQGDVLVVDFATRSNVIYTNADWTFPQSDTTGNTTNNTTGSIVSYQTGYCIRGSSAPSYTFNRTGGSRCLGTVRAYRSSRAGTPSFDTSAEVAMASAGTTVTLTGGVTTTDIDELLVTAVYGARANTVSNMDGTTEVTGNSGATDTTTPPVLGTWTERSDRNNGTSPTVALACYDTIKRTAGSTGNLTATESQSARHGMTAMAFKHPAVSGSPYSVIAGQGTFSITGVAAGVKRGYPLAASQGSYAITGVSAALRHAFKTVASVGSYAINGVSAGLLRTYNLASSAGSYSIAGVSAGLKKGFNLAASTGAYSITGVSAGFVRTYSTAANTGSFSITGQNAVLRYSPDVIGGSGIFTINGQTVGLKVERQLGAGVGSVVITGQDATLTYTPTGAAYFLTADAASFTITGQAAGLLKGSNLVSDAGSYLITGESAGLKLGKNLLAGQGVFQIDGQSVILGRSSVAGHDTGEFHINGVSATLNLNRNLQVGAGSYSISGQDVNFSIGATGQYSIEAEVGLFYISGKDANLNYGVKAGGRSASWRETWEKKNNPPKLPERTYWKVHPNKPIEIKTAALKLSSAGGRARAESLTKKQRVHIATVAAKARWK